MSTAEIAALMPYDPCLTTTTTASSLSLPTEVNQMEGVDWTVDCVVVPGQSDTRSYTISSLRPSIR